MRCDNQSWSHITIFVFLAMSIPEFHTQHVFIADDDEDDRLLFQEVVRELPYLVHLSVARDGEETLESLQKMDQLPDVLFLDLNMPIKNGIECLSEIKESVKLKFLPVVIFSTSSYPSNIDKVYEVGAHLYIRKPNDFLSFKKSIHYVFAINWKKKLAQPPRDEFVLTL
jgi:CheY-like chemotaxis protein